MLGLFKDYETDEPEELHNLIQDATAGEIRQHLLIDPWSVQRHNENGLLPLHLLVQRDGDDVNELLDVFISYNADINGKTVIEGDTALHILVKNVPSVRALPTARKLLSCGSDPAIRNKRLRSAYDYAIQKGNREMVEVLNSEKWQMDSMALVTAVTKGTVDDIKKIIRLGGDVNMRTETGSSPIHYVITHRQSHDKGVVIDLLLQHKANINSQNQDKDTAIHLAIKELQNDNELYLLVQYLLNMGCDPTIPNRAGSGAIDLAIEKEYNDIVELLESRVAGNVKADLFKNVTTGNVKGTRAILDEDESATRMFSKEEPIEKESALEATHEEEEEGMEEVQPASQPDFDNLPPPEGEDGIHPHPSPRGAVGDEEEDENGLNPLHVVAIQEPHPNQLTMIDTLVERGADVNAQTLKLNDTALHLAAKHDNAEVIKRLLINRADPDQRNNKGKTPYEEAADREFTKSMEAFESYFEARAEAEEDRRRGRQREPPPPPEEKKKSGTCVIL